MNEPENQQEDIDSIAAAWAARLGGDPLSDAERRDLDHWLDASPAHATAFEEARFAWDKMGQLRFAPGALARDIVAPDARVAPALAAAAPGPRRRRLWVQAAALAACLLLMVGAAGIWFGDPSTLLTADHRTVPGAQQQVALADGSAVTLGPASAIAVRYSETERRIELLAGLALFTAAPMGESERRPFVVAAANGTARALGTQFMVERLAETTEVTVIEHDVEVALTGQGGLIDQDERVDQDERETRVIVTPGHTVRYLGSGLGEVRPVNLDHATAWRRGRLIVDGMPLGDVVAELNRYRRGRIVITDPALSSRKVSGAFDVTDPDTALAIIARDLHIETASLPPLVTLLY